MNQYLKSASDRFSKLIGDKQFAISPISEIDGEIITSITELFVKLDKREVVQILKQYKYLKDEEINDLLLQCNLDSTAKQYEKIEQDGGYKKLLDQIDELTDKLKSKREFITLKNERFAASIVFAYRVEEDYIKNTKYVGKLIINPTDVSATKQPLHANYTITCEDEDEFTELIESFEIQMEQSGVEFNKEGKEEE